MGYDRTRPIPWKPLVRWALVITVVLNVTYFLFSRDQYGPSLIVASVGGGLVYVLLGAVLSKFGWSPASVRPRQAAAEARAAREQQRAASTPTLPNGRPKPAATRRTNAGNRRTPPRAKR